MDDEERIRKLVRAVIQELFETVGVDVSTPEGRKEFRENIDWIQAFRVGASNARSTALGVGVTTLFGGALWLLWQGLKTAFAVAKGVP